MRSARLDRLLWEVVAPLYHRFVTRLASEGVYADVVVPRVFEKLRTLPSGGRVLDIGCGSGGISNRIAGELGFRVDGIDFSTYLIAQATKAGGGATFHNINAEDIDKLEGTFDGVVANMSLHDMARLDVIVKRIAGKLADHGTIVFTVPHPCFFGPGTDRYFTQGKSDHLELRTYRTLTSFMKDMSFTKVRHHHHTLSAYFAMFAEYELLAFEELHSEDKSSPFYEFPFCALFHFRKRSA